MKIQPTFINNMEGQERGYNNRGNRRGGGHRGNRGGATNNRGGPRGGGNRGGYKNGNDQKPKKEEPAVVVKKIEMSANDWMSMF